MAFRMISGDRKHRMESSIAKSGFSLPTTRVIRAGAMHVQATRDTVTRDTATRDTVIRGRILPAVDPVRMGTAHNSRGRIIPIQAIPAASPTLVTTAIQTILIRATVGTRDMAAEDILGSQVTTQEASP